MAQLSSFIARRIAFNKQRSFSRFIIRLSVIATALSISAMIITLSFVNGFQDVVSEKVFSFWGHVRVQYRQPMKANIAEELPIDENKNLEARISRMKGVSSIHAFATKSAILKTSQEIEGILLKGFDTSYKFRHLAPFLVSGRWLRFSDSSYAREIVVSKTTAEQMQLRLNDKVLIYFVRSDGSLRPDKLTIVGIYKTGIDEYDKNFALGDIKLIRRLNGWKEGEIGGYEIYLNDYKKMETLSEAIYSSDGFPPLWETKTVRELHPTIFDWLNIVSYNGRILIIIVTIIVIINFITCLIILVLERIKMIGILKAIGATNWQIQKVFIYHSVLITAAGILIGSASGVGLLWLQQKTGFVKLKEAEYYMQTAAVRIDLLQVVIVIGGSLLLSFIILLIPSLLVRKILPIRAIRFR